MKGSRSEGEEMLQALVNALTGSDLDQHQLISQSLADTTLWTTCRICSLSA
jgi:hypothetical protein